MPNLVFAVWTEDAARIPNESVADRINRLNTQIALVRASTQPSFIVFAGAEFLFMHASNDGTQLRWYSPAERNAALAGMAAASRRFGRLLLVGGTICWAKAVTPTFGKTEWWVRNEAPVYYNGLQLALYGKRFPGGEVSKGEDALRLYGERRGSVDLDMYVVDAPDEQGRTRYKLIQATGNLRTLASQAENTVRRGAGGTKLPAAPGLKKAVDHYQDRMHFVAGTTDATFAVPGGNFTGGVEICQEHNGPGQNGRGTLQANSARGSTNFHVLTSNTVDHKPGYENLRSPGYFVHAKAGCPPELIELQGTNKTSVPANLWQEIHPALHAVERPMPNGL